MMKLSKKVLHMILVLCAIQSYAQNSDKDTLHIDFQRSIDMLIENNHSIQGAYLEQEYYEYQKKISRALYLPKLSINATYTLFNDDIKMEEDISPLSEGLENIIGQLSEKLPRLPIPEIDIPNSVGVTIQERQMFLLTANAMQPVFMGGKIIAANRAAKAKLEETTYGLEHIKDQEITELASRYYGLILAKKAVEIRQKVLDGIGQHLSDAKKLEENGIISRAELLHAEVAYANAEKELKGAIMDAELMETALQNTLATETVVMPISDLIITDQNNNVEYFQNLAEDHNPQLKQLDSKKTQVEQLIKKEKSGYLPDVALIGSANLAEWQVTDLMPNWFVGIGLHLNLFDGLGREAKIKAAKIRQEEVSLYKEKAASDIRTVVKKTYQEMKKAKEEFEALQKSKAFAEEYLRVRTAAFNEGFSTSTEVVDAQLNLSKTEVDQLKATYTHQMAMAKMFEWCGISAQFVQMQP